MNKALYRFLAVALLANTTSHAGLITWDGGGGNNSWQNNANWDPDGAPAASDDVVISDGSAVVYTPGGDLTINGGGSLTISGGSSWTQNPTNWTQINGGTLNLDNGTFTRSSGGNLVTSFNPSGNGVINAEASTLSVGGNLILGFNSGGTGVLTAKDSTINVGGEVWFGHATQRTNVTAQINLENSTLDANGSVGIWFWGTDATGNTMTLNVLGPDSVIAGRVGRRNSLEQNNAVTWETLWNEGVLQYNGSNAGAFSSFFVTSGTPGTASYTLTSVVPEPSSTTILAIICGLSTFLRRRRTLAK